MTEEYIKLQHSLLDHIVFSHPVSLKIWIWCLLKANYKPSTYLTKIGIGSTIVNLKSGEFVFSRTKAEGELDIDSSTVYRWIMKFKNPEYNLISIKANNNFTIITICNWDSYQNINFKDEQQTSNKRATNEPSIEEVKKYFKDKGFMESSAELFFNHYEARDWIDRNNKPVLNWKGKAVSVWFKDDAKIKSIKSICVR